MDVKTLKRGDLVVALTLLDSQGAKTLMELEIQFRLLQQDLFKSEKH